MQQILARRAFLQAVFGFAVLAIGRGRALTENRKGSSPNMAKDIVMVHGANEGGWCFDKFRGVFETLGWTCRAPDLIGHGSDAADAKTRLVGVGMGDYLAQLRTLLKTFAAPPVLLGHSMGGILVQQLAAEGLARALILVAPAPRSGILPATGSETRLDQDMMSLGAFWNTVINPDFDLAKVLTLNCVPAAEQRAVFDKFGPESGLAFFQMFFWMFDKTNATAVDTKKVRCPVLCLVGKDDKMVSPASARMTTSAYAGSTFWELDGHGHMLVLEPGAEDIARRIASWIPS
jgi:pimeloyl-ACP methyl ester carboxylesterase